VTRHVRYATDLHVHPGRESQCDTDVTWITWRQDGPSRCYGAGFARYTVAVDSQANTVCLQPNRHERITMAVSETVTGDSDMAPEGTPFRRVRMDDDLWERLDEAVKRADPDSNRSVLIRRFARWFVGDIDEMPRRPEPRAPENDSGPR